MRKQSIQQKTDHTNGSNLCPSTHSLCPVDLQGLPLSLDLGHMTGQVIHHSVLPWTAFSIEGLNLKALLS